MLLSGLVTTKAQSVIADYAFSESTGVAYTDITTLPGYVAGTNSIISGTFTNVANFTTAYPIGFNFAYNNTVFTDVYISDNGYLIFKSPTGVTPLPAVTIVAPISNTTAYLGAVSGYGVSLTGTAADIADVSYLTTGSAGSRIFTVQYKNLRRNNLANRDNVMNFQIRLYEANNQIEVLFRDFTTTYTTQFKGQVGLRGGSNTDFNNRKNSASSNFTASVGPATGTATVNTDGMITQLVGATVWGPLPGTSFVWTPCFNPTSLVLALQPDNTTVNFSWTAPAYLSGTTYDWEVRTSGAPGSGGVGLYNSGSTTSTSATVLGLTVGQPYTFYVRSSCKTIVPWTRTPAVAIPSDFISGTITPSCSTPLIVPYFQDFETSVMPAVPLCTLATPVVDQPMVVRNYNVYGFGSKNLITGGNIGTGLYGTGSTNATNTWWFSRGITLSTGGQYKLSYKYGGTREQAFFIQKMKVAIGTAQTPAGMTIVLADHNNIKTSPNTFSVNFTVATGGTYFLGFQGYAGANNGYLQIDDIALVVSTCFAPTALTATQIYSNSANISWTAPVSAPSGGYDYYFDTVSTTPTSTTVPRGSTLAGTVLAGLTGLTPSTVYYYWVRSSCGGSDYSEWSAMGTFTTLTPPCVPAPTSVDGTGITKVVFGTISNTTGAEPGRYGDYTSLSNNVSQTTTASITLTYSTAGFGYYTRVWIDWNNDGDFADTGENVYDSVTELPSGTSTFTFNVPASVGTVTDTSGPHRMRIGGADSDTLAGFAAGQGPCYNGAYGTFEDYTINVIAPPPPLTISSATTTFCSGQTSPTVTITTPLANFTSYNWSPSSFVSGTPATGYTFNPTATTVYTLTATILSGGNLYTNTATYTVNVNPSPTPITITPATASYCQGDPPVLLTATGGIISGVPIFTENFNGGTNTFTEVHNSVNGSATLAWWTVRPSPYSLPAANTDDPLTIISNDSSQFYMSDSDIQGSTGNTNEELISPTFSLIGYSDANLSFWHHYKQFSNGSATVEVSTNGGGTWTVLPGATWTTVSQGTATGFVNVVLPLSAYAFAGNTNNNMKIKFKYVSNYGYRWCIDNVMVSGSSTSNTIWSPNTNLYTNAAGTLLYDGVSPRATIYAKPAGNITYTATVTTPGPAFCPATKTVAVTFVPLVAGTATGDQTITCGSAPSSISVSGYLPNVATSITRWESANNAAFTGAVTIAGSANQATLTPALLGSVTTTTYYRAVITGCNTVYSNTVTITVTANTWNGATWSAGPPTSSDGVIVDGNLTIAADLSVCSMKVLAGRTVIVNPGVTLTVENAIDVNPTATVTFEDTASLLQGSTTTVNSNSGKIKYKKSIYIRRLDYTYWSSPVSIQTLFDLSPSTLADKYFFWNTTNAQWQTLFGGAFPMTTGVGYIIRGPENHTPGPSIWNTGFFQGTPNNGDYSVPIVKTALANGDMNLIGNPYPSALDADLFVLNNASAFPTGTTMYFWSHNLALNPVTLQYDGANQFALYNSSGGTGTGSPAVGFNNLPPTGKIATGQGFFVKGTFAGTGTRTANFHNDMRVSGNNNNFYRSAQSLEKNRVWLDLTDNNQNFKQILVGYIQNATNGFEEGFDGEAFPVDNSSEIYSFYQDKKLTIQGRALPFDANDQVPLGFKAAAVGSYTIALSKFDGLFTDVTVGVFLEDRLLNVMHDLRQGAYTFVSEAGTFDTRFVLRYTASALNVNPSNFDANSVVAFKHNDDIHVEASNLLMKSVKILDIRGRMILERNNINKNSVVIENIGVANQVLVVQITSVDGSVVNKKIIF